MGRIFPNSMHGEFWLVLGLIAAIAVLSGFIHSAIGFGFGIVAISLMPFVIDARSAHVVVSVSSVPMLVMAAWVYREGFEWQSLWQAVLGAAVFLPLGLFLFESVSLDWLVRGTGVAILGMVLISLRNQYGKSGAAKKTAGGACFTAGAVAGFLAGAVSIAGPPVAAFALKQDWSQARFKAFVTQCLLVIAIYKAVLLAARGYIVGDAIGHTVMSAAFSILGVQLGVIASRRISAARFKRLVAITLILVSCWMIWRGQGERSEESTRPEPSSSKADSESRFDALGQIPRALRYPGPHVFVRTWSPNESKTGSCN